MSETTSKAVTIAAGKTPVGIVPSTFDEVQRMAQMVVSAGMFKATDKNQAVAQATMALMQGLEIGISPMQAANGIAIINGRPCIWGSLVPALIWKAGHKIEEWVVGEDMEMVAHCRITRSDNDIAVERTFSAKEAKQAGLLEKPGPWKQYRKRMLAMRARGFAANDGVPDVLRGMYTVEEMQDVTVEERGSVTAVPDIPPPPPEIDQDLNQDREFLSEVTAPADEEQMDLEAAIQAELVAVALANLETKAHNASDPEDVSQAFEEFEAETDGKSSVAAQLSAEKIMAEHLARLVK